jgi:hypothetical protein
VISGSDGLVPWHEMLKTTMPPKRRSSPDDFQTPPEALTPLLPYLPKGWTIWEPAAGKGYLASALRGAGYRVIASDILTGQDFLRWQPAEPWDAIVTNPPYSLRREFIARCYALGRPWAMLMTLTTLEGRRQELFRRHGVELLLLDRRVNFETPNGTGSGAWFPVAWFCWRLLPDRICYGRLEKRCDSS